MGYDESRRHVRQFLLMIFVCTYRYILGHLINIKQFKHNHNIIYYTYYI